MPAFRFAELSGLARLAFGLPRFLRDRLSYVDAERLVRDGVARRQERFLKKLEEVVFARRHSPYLALFRWAGCEFGDVGKLVARDGVEGALDVMCRAGIYVTWEELRGRRPAVRGSVSFDFSWHDFDNPLVRSHYHSTSGGSSGAPVRVSLDLEHDAQAAPSWAVLFKAHGLEDSPLIFWTPTHAGLAARYLKCSKFGKDFEKWFATTRMTSLEDRVRAGVVHAIARRCAGYPKPENAPLTEAGRVLDYLLQRLDDGARPVVNTSPSAAVLLARAAGERGRSLAGVHFLLGAEPVTPARSRAIQASGAKPIPTYGTSEAGWIGAQFPGVQEPDTVHVFREAYAVIPRADGEASGAAAHPLLLTNLRPAGPKVLINAEIGDSAVIETGCAEEPAVAYGYDVRLHTIRSFRKITVWGGTFAVADLEDIIEETLPARFGGAIGDYQLIEQQDDGGVPLLRLLVSPTIGLIDEQAMKDTLLREMARKRTVYGFMTEDIRVTNTLKIERRTPVATARGKIPAVMPQGAHLTAGALVNERG